jgi:hypothetical protein
VAARFPTRQFAVRAPLSYDGRMARALLLLGIEVFIVRARLR